MIKHQVISHKMIRQPICGTLSLETANVIEDSSSQTEPRSQEILVKALFWVTFCPPEARFEPKMSLITSQKSTKNFMFNEYLDQANIKLTHLWPSDAIWRSV